MKKKQCLVLTSINSDKMPGIVKLKNYLEIFDETAVVVADLQTPIWESHPNIEFISVEMQDSMWPNLSKLLPFNHYSRKNLGYLYAASLGAERFLDTDDDNCPTGDPWAENFVNFRKTNNSNWLNVYRYFGELDLWPRGLPLNHAHTDHVILETSRPKEVSCFQSIVDGDPDIDAIGRLLFPKKVYFKNENPLVLSSAICPTNSQATIWMGWLLPLLYLPSTATFRMTDIWRGFVVQPAIRVLGGETVFGKLGFRQDRNEHNLLKDFESEAIGHIHSQTVYEVSKGVWNSDDFSRNPDSLLRGMNEIYKRLVKLSIIDQKELEIINAWSEAVTSSN
jgi:hypothetical protein